MQSSAGCTLRGFSLHTAAHNFCTRYTSPHMYFQHEHFLQVRMQLGAGGGHPVAAAKLVYGEAGLRGMYAGLSAAVTRQAVYTTLRVGLYDWIRVRERSRRREGQLSRLHVGEAAKAQLPYVLHTYNARRFSLTARVSTFKKHEEILFPRALGENAHSSLTGCFLFFILHLARAHRYRIKMTATEAPWSGGCCLQREEDNDHVPCSASLHPPPTPCRRKPRRDPPRFARHSKLLFIRLKIRLKRTDGIDDDDDDSHHTTMYLHLLGPFDPL